MTNISHTERKFFIGGSEIASLFGLSPYCTKYELWHRKAGNLPEPDFDNERVAAGNFMEPAIAAWAQDKFGLRLRRVRRYMAHSVVNGYGTSLDYETVEGHYPAEIKNVDGLIFRDNWDVEGDTIVEAPMHIVLQLQAQMACAKKDKGYLIVCVGGNRLYMLEVMAHTGTQQRLEREVEAFWASIRANKEPKPDFEKDGAAIAELYRVSGEDVVDLTGNNHFTHLAQEYADGAAQEKAGAVKKSAAKAEMLTIMGDAAKAIIPGFSVSAKTTKDTQIEAHTRKGYRNFRVTQVKQKQERQAA